MSTLHVVRDVTVQSFNNDVVTIHRQRNKHRHFIVRTTFLSQLSADSCSGRRFSMAIVMWAARQTDRQTGVGFAANTIQVVSYDCLPCSQVGVDQYGGGNSAYANWFSEVPGSLDELLQFPKSNQVRTAVAAVVTFSLSFLSFDSITVWTRMYSKSVNPRRIALVSIAT